MRLFLVLFLGLTCWSGSYAQKYFTISYTEGDGLLTNQVRDVVADPHGFIWVASDAGLQRFDGRQFVSYTNQLDSRSIRAFVRLPDGTILFSSDTGIHQIHTEQDTARISLFIAGEIVVTDSTLFYPNQLYLDRTNRLWISQPNGQIACWQDGQLCWYDFPIEQMEGHSYSAFSLVETQDGQLWLATPGGKLFHYKETEDQFIALDVPIPLDWINCLYAEGNTLWIGGNDLYRLSTQEAGFPGQLFATGGLDISSIYVDRQFNRMLIGTANEGLFGVRLQNNSAVFRQIFASNDPHRIDPLPFQEVMSIYQDQRANLWLSTGEGLGLLQARFFETVFGLANNNTLTILAQKDTSVLVSFGDVYALSAQDGEWSGQLLALEQEGFVTGFSAANGDLWMSTNNGQLVRYDSTAPALLTEDLSQRGGGIFFMETDTSGRVWICQAPERVPIIGVACRLADGTIKEYGPDEGLTDRILVVRQSPQGRIYAAGIGKDTYLYQYMPEDDRFRNLSVPLPFPPSPAFEVHDLAIDNRGIVWMGTTDGLLRFDLERVERVDLGEFSTTEIRSLNAVGAGSLWLATDTEGLIHYDDQRQSSTVFAEESGLPSIIASYRCLSQSSDGRLWAGTAEGLVYSQDPFPGPGQTMTPVLLNLTLDGEKIEAENIIRMGNQSRLVVQWVSPMYPGDRIQYEYRLRGHPDTSWHKLETRARHPIAGLPFGDYEFILRARQNGGFQWSEQLVVPFEVIKPWYRRSWAFALYFLAGLWCLYYFFQFNIGRLLKRINILEQRIALRDRALEVKEEQLKKQESDLATETVVPRPIGQAIENDFRLLSVVSRLTQKLKPNAKWTEVLPRLSEEMHFVTGIDHLEVGWHEHDDFCLQSTPWPNGDPVLRRELFEPASSLAVRALVNKKALVINDFTHTENAYNEIAEDLIHHSAYFCPLEIPGKQLLVLCFYSQQAHYFDPQIQLLLSMLSQHLAAVVQDQLSSQTFNPA